MSHIGIDINPSHSILVELNRAGFEYEAGRAAILPGYEHEPDASVNSGASSDLARALSNIPSSLRRRGALVSISGREVMFRNAAVGSSDPESVRAIVRLEVDTLASAGSKMMAAHQRIEDPEGNPMALIGIAREELIEHYAGTLKNAGLTCNGFVPGPISLYQCYLMSGSMDYEGVMMIANIADRTTDIIMVSVGSLLFSRTINYGVVDMVERVAQDVGVNNEQARETLFSRISIKPGVVDDNASGDRAVLAAQDAASKLYAQLNAAIAHARAQLQSRELDPGRILICGSGASISGMREFLMSRFRKTVEGFNPLAGVNTSKLDEASANTLNQYATTLAIPLGLAKIAADRAAGSIVFEPPSVIVRRNFFQRTAWLYAGILVLVLSLAFALAFSNRLENAAAEVKTQANDMAANYTAHHLALLSQPIPPGAGAEDRVNALSELNRDNLILEQTTLELLEARRPGADALRILNDLVKELPEDAIITSYVLEAFDTRNDSVESGITIDFFLATSADDIAQLYGRVRTLLKEHDLVERIEPRELTEVEDGSGKTANVRVFLKDASSVLREDE